jgi:hypothetical protein
MEKQFPFYDSEVSKFSMSGNSYWSENPDLTLLVKQNKIIAFYIKLTKLHSNCFTKSINIHQE